MVGRQARAWQQQVQGLLEASRAGGISGSGRPHPPDTLRARLRPYQLDGFGWLAFLWQHRLGGILADDMGLGKTLEALALICHARQQDPAGAPFLVVAPTSVAPNWAAESARFAPGLKVVTITDTLARSGADLAQVIAGADVVITSYTLLRLDFDAHLAAEWSGLILDEAQYVKNHQSKIYQCARRLRAPFKVAVTGTPMENNLMELWSLLSITAPGLFPNPTRFRDYYARPIERQGDAELLARLRRRIRPLLRRRTKEQVAADLPEKQEQVLEVELHPRHRKLYQTYLQRERQKVLGLLDDVNANRFTILTFAHPAAPALPAIRGWWSPTRPWPPRLQAGRAGAFCSPLRPPTATGRWSSASSPATSLIWSSRPFSGTAPGPAPARRQHARGPPPDRD